MFYRFSFGRAKVTLNNPEIGKKGGMARFVQELIIIM
jgi:hypothetical protein